MVDMGESPGLLSSSPSLSAYSANRLEEIAARVISELGLEGETEGCESILPVRASPSDQVKRIPPVREEEAQAEAVDFVAGGDDSDSEDFEFAFVCRDPDAAPISADEIFANGQIRPLFPVFNRDVWFEDSADNGKDREGGSERPQASVRVPLRKLFIADREPPAAAAAATVDELEQLPPGSYCVWSPRSVPPSPDRCKKSSSTGSSKRWRFRDLLHRSSSDGKDTFLFLSPATTGKEVKADAPKAKKTNKAKSTESAGNPLSVHELHYARNRDGDRRRTFLPYRQDIVGFFANVNGLSRSLHPF